MKNPLKDIKNIVIGLLIALTAIVIFRAGMRLALWVAAGVSICVFLDFLAYKIIFGRAIVPKSAVITGFIISGILDYYQPWHILFIFLALAVASKYFIRFKGKHFLNPANLALFIASIFQIPLTWSIGSNIYAVIIAGIYIAYSLRKIPHIIGFLIVFAGLFSACGIKPLLLANWFFVFIMLIEPKTSGFGRLRGLIFGAMAGAASFLMYKFFPQADFFTGGLFIANLFNPLLDKIKK